MADTVLFLCPHGAAKSVLAAALFERLAAEQGLPLRATCAGTEPDPEVAPHVRALLEREGLPLPLDQPQLVTHAMLDGAAWVIALGCPFDELPGTPRRWEQWDDVPPPSQDLQGAHARIAEHLAVWLAALGGEVHAPLRGAESSAAAPSTRAKETHDAQ
jgi:arsenate reductase (thioredoxin)